MTIPRLELCGALTSARLITKIRTILKIHINRTVLWFDSTIVLGWLKKEPTQLSQFVGNRVREIQLATNACEWRYVASEENPADLLSHGISPQKIETERLWWNGPRWLQQNEADWPNTKFTIPILPEIKQQVLLVKNQTSPLIEFERYSDANRLERVLAWCMRFCKNAKSTIEMRIRGPLKFVEIHQANIQLARLAQSDSFSSERETLSDTNSLDAKNRLLKLNPFIHTDETIRVGGRLAQSDFSFDKRHPIILANNHHFTKLLFRREHIRLFHAGPQALLASTRNKYWTISGRNLARKIVHECNVCFRHNLKPLEPIMGSLPSDRVNLVPAFHTTGVDYAGPILIKDKKGRGSKLSKSYICLFICFVTRAVHLELVTDLTTDAFILAMRRFASRRGMPVRMKSDNGLNFVGASNELKDLGDFLKSNETTLYDRLTHENFNWSFIPSYSPHFVRLWEAGVKSAKFHLKRVLGNATLTYEELYTVLTQIEAILNSRPLSPFSSNVLDYQPLTPAHFLVGKPLTSVPDPDVTHIPESRLSNHQRIQQLQQHFWKRWSHEVISELQTRSKWRQQQDSIREGALVLIKDNNAPPLKWLLGRVEKLHPGPDGINRVVSVKTSKGLIKRSVVKLCPLPEA